jgi:hypothetical protein
MSTTKENKKTLKGPEQLIDMSHKFTTLGIHV